MNRYESIFNLPNEAGTIVATPFSITSESMEEAVTFITADKGAEPFSVSLKELDARVVDLVSKVTFTTTVTPSEAQTAGAIATPTTYSVVSTTKVLFQAVAPDGFSFVKWTKNGVDAGTDSIMSIGITVDNTEIVAVFVAT